MNISKIQILYLFISLGFFVLLILITFYGFSPTENGQNDVVKQELANLDETGETTILKGEKDNVEFILRLKYEDSRRHPFFVEQLAEQWGFNHKNYSVFILEIINNPELSETVEPETTTDENAENEENQPEIEKADEPAKIFSLDKIKLILLPKNAENEQLDTLKLESATSQGKLEIAMQKSKISLSLETKITKYVFFAGNQNFFEIKEAKLIMADGEEIILKPEKISYPKPPTIS